MFDVVFNDDRFFISGKGLCRATQKIVAPAFSIDAKNIRLSSCLTYTLLSCLNINNKFFT